MDYENDIRLIKVIGFAVSVLGIILLLITLAVAVVGTLNVTSVSAGAFTFSTVIKIFLAFTMALAMSSCGAQLARPQPLVPGGLENLRLCWAALFGIMLITWLAGFWLLPALGGLSLIVILLLMVIRPALIRLS